MAAASGLSPKEIPIAIYLTARPQDVRPSKRLAGRDGSSPVTSICISIPKAYFGKPRGVQEFVIKAFLLEVEEIRTPYEPETNPNATPRGFPQKKPRRCSLRVAR